MNKFLLSRGLFFVILFIFANSAFSQKTANAYSNLDKSQITTGVLYDMAKTPVSNIENFNGKSVYKEIDSKTWRQVYFEIYNSSLEKNIPEINSFRKDFFKSANKKVFPISVINYSYQRIKKDAEKNNLIKYEGGKVVQVAENIYDLKSVFATSVFHNVKYTSLNPVFDFSEKYYFSNKNEKILYYLVDFDNGKAEVKVNVNDQIKVNYSEEGEKTIKIKAHFSDNSVLKSSFSFKIKQGNMPEPTEFWEAYTANLSYLSEYAVADVAVFLGEGNTEITRPVLIVDGFDPDNQSSMEELFDLANQQDLVLQILAEGYDLVLVNFYGGADYVQRNALLTVNVIEEINTRLINSGNMKEANQIAVIGPSMGGLITRYAIRYMELNSLPHNVRTYISFDSPQKGANIPLGLQHWVRFYAQEAEIEAAQESLYQINKPAAKQMMIYHYLATSGNTAGHHNLRTSFVSEYASMGYPEQCRNVSISNGSGIGVGLDYQPGQQIIYYYYRSFAVDLDGDVWAIPNQENTRIFQGLYDTAAPFDEVTENIYVSNTLPYDAAPGGYRNSLLQIDETDTGGYGDIIAPYDNHCFIPVISSLDIENTNNPYFNVNDNVNSIQTPFDKLYYPQENQGHVDITPESLNWFKHEIINYSPQFDSEPIAFINEDSEYIYHVEYSDVNEWNNVEITDIQKPDWLSFNTETKTLHGTPVNENVGEYNISFTISDGLDETIQEFTLIVNNTNDIPVVENQIQDTTVYAGADFSYTFANDVFYDEDQGDNLTYSAELSDGTSLPAWLSFIPEARTFFGSPDESEIVEIRVFANDNSGLSVFTDFTITAIQNTTFVEIEKGGINIYPNPCKNEFYINIENTDNSIIVIRDISGKIIDKIIATKKINLINTSNYSKGLYTISITKEKSVLTQKIIIQ